MAKMVWRYRITVKMNGTVYYANRVPGMELPRVAWHPAAGMYPDHFTDIESHDICQLYSDQKATRYRIRVDIEEKEDA